MSISNIKKDAFPGIPKINPKQAASPGPELTISGESAVGAQPAVSVEQTKLEEMNVLIAAARALKGEACKGTELRKKSRSAIVCYEQALPLAIEKYGERHKVVADIISEIILCCGPNPDVEDFSKATKYVRKWMDLGLHESSNLQIKYTFSSAVTFYAETIVPEVQRRYPERTQLLKDLAGPLIIVVFGPRSAQYQALQSLQETPTACCVIS